MSETIIYLSIGIIVILAAWVPLFLGKLPVSLPMVSVALGLVLGLIAGTHDPFTHDLDLLRRVSEFALVLAVLGGGLKIDRPFTISGWASAWRLLTLGMLITIMLTALAAHYLLNLPLGLAILLGSALAPTDPVLASDYSAGPPGTGEEGETKFALTSEAGLNDGLAFPFIVLGLSIALEGMQSAEDVWRWLALDLAWNVAAGAAMGIAAGWCLVKINDALPEHLRIAASNSGLVAVGLAFLAYGLASSIHANGFVAAFCLAVGIRNFQSKFEYSRRLNHAAEQFERVSMVLVLTALGLSIAAGRLNDIGWNDAAFVAILLLLIRPLSVVPAFIGSPEDRWTRLELSYFGIRGIASIYYVAYVGPMLANEGWSKLATIVSFVIACSVFFFGSTAHVVATRLSGREKFDH